MLRKSLTAPVIIACVTTLLLSYEASSQTAAQQNNFFAAVTFDNTYDDNANRVGDNVLASPIEERQYSYSLLLGADFRRPLILAAANYSFIEQGFTKDSQQDQSFVIGASRVSLGNETSWYALNASHDQRRSLIANDQELILANTQEQEVISVSPEIKSKPSGFLQIGLRGEYTRTKNELTTDSDRFGAELSAVRRLSPSRNVSLSIERREVDLKEIEELNYSYERASLAYNSTTRLSTFSVSLGRDKISPDVNDSISSDFYSLQLRAFLNYFDVALSARSELTDTSNLDVIQIDVENVIGTAVQGVDQVKADTASLSASSDNLCVSCSISTSAQYQKLENNNNTLESNESIIYTVSFGYEITAHSSLQTRYLDREADFFNDAARSLREKRIRIAYQRELSRSLESTIFVERSEQSGETNGFDRNTFGLQLSLRLE